MNRQTVHIVGGASQSRAEQARAVFALGHHAEVYSDSAELAAQSPNVGIILLAETGSERATARAIAQIGELGMALPVVVTSPDVELDLVIAAISAGALDYLPLPLELNRFARRLLTLAGVAETYQARQSRLIQARQRLESLSGRERQVLALLSDGLANKEIAATLGISPRTVEIHRGNMMTKLGARHPADAVRAWLAAAPAAPSTRPLQSSKPRFLVKDDDEAPVRFRA